MGCKLSYMRCFERSCLTSHCAATKEFDELCFQFGIELDEDVSIVIYRLLSSGTLTRDIVRSEKTTEDVKGTDERPVSEAHELASAELPDINRPPSLQSLKIDIPANR